MKNKQSSGDERLLGLDRPITRRDFVGGALAGAGAILLDQPAPAVVNAAPATDPAQAWNGYAGIGDYARSNGNTYQAHSIAHLIRDGKVADLVTDATDTGETFDVVVAGGGFSGTGAALTFQKEAKPGKTCLVLENHALSGGEAKRNEFIVDGFKITGPQGSNLVVPPTTAGDWYANLWNELGIPTAPSFRPLSGTNKKLRFSRDNFFPMIGVGDQIPSSGYFFDQKTFGGNSRWDVNAVESGYRNTAFSPAVKNDLRQLSEGIGKNRGGDGWQEWLDSITFADYLENVLGMHADTSRLFDHTLCLEGGLGADSVSALLALRVGQPGFDKGFPENASLYRCRVNRPEDVPAWSFPGGNDAVYRLLLKRVLPNTIRGGSSFEAVHEGAYQFDAFDRAGAPVRIRLGSTVLKVVSEGSKGSDSGVSVYYHRDGRIHRVRAKGLVSCMGGWVNRRVVQDLPDDYQQALGGLNYGSAMIVNVALTNWRFLDRLGITAAHYFMDGALGQTMNIRQPMEFGLHPPPLDPSKPIVLTMYCGFSKRGLPAHNQAVNARWALLSKSYRDIELDVRRQMTELFSQHGFDAKRDIAGIVLNRWGHSYVVPEPGFYYGQQGRAAPSSVLKRRTGCIAFGHSELNGVQEWFGGVENGQRAMAQILEIV